MWRGHGRQGHRRFDRLLWALHEGKLLSGNVHVLITLFNFSKVAFKASIGTWMVGVKWLRVAKKAVAVTPNNQFLRHLGEAGDAGPK